LGPFGHFFTDSPRDGARRDWVRSANFSPISRATIRAERARRLGSFGQNFVIRRASRLPNCEGAEEGKTLSLHTISGGRLDIS